MKRVAWDEWSDVSNLFYTDNMDTIDKNINNANRAFHANDEYIDHLESVIEKMRVVNSFYGEGRLREVYMKEKRENDDEWFGCLQLSGKRARQLELWLKENYDKDER